MLRREILKYYVHLTRVKFHGSTSWLFLSVNKTHITDSVQCFRAFTWIDLYVGVRIHETFNIISGQGVAENFFSGGQLKSEETSEDPMEFEKQIWLAETGQYQFRTHELR